MSSTNFGAETTADEASAAFSKHIRGKTILITGVSPKGIGAVSAISIAKHSPNLIILANRDLGKAEATASNIASVAPGVVTRILHLDLASLKSVREAAAEVNKYPEMIDVLMNNAGIMGIPTFTKTEDGFESKFGVNHLGHFLFTSLIFDKIPRGGRVINVSSNAHRYSDVRFDDLWFRDGELYEKHEAYGQSKTANMLFSVALAAKAKSKGVLSFSLHPGAILDTNLSRHMSKEELMERVRKVAPAGTYFKNLEQGAATQIVASFDPTIEDKNGSFLADCKVVPPLKPYASDPIGAEKLWKLSEQLVGLAWPLGEEGN